MEHMRKSVDAAVKPESMERAFNASLGFDFIFSKDSSGALRCYCIEINGHDTGVRGVQDVPDAQIDRQHKLLADIRSTNNPTTMKKYRVASGLYKDMRTGDFQATPDGKKRILEYMHKSLHTESMFKHAHRNPEFIENITLDKRVQEKYIPDENRPRTWREGDGPTSSTGAWVVKHINSRCGDGVYVFSNREFAEFIEEPEDLRQQFIAQEFIQSSGAQTMSDSADKRAASMRLLMDFQYRPNGDIVPDFITAYQRVSPRAMNGEKDPDGRRPSLEERYVVNRKRGAASASVSAEEMTIAREVAEKIIHAIADDYRKNGSAILQPQV